MKPLVEVGSDRILGFTAFGPEAGELMGVVQVAMLAGQYILATMPIPLQSHSFVSVRGYVALSFPDCLTDAVIAVTPGQGWPARRR